MKSTSLISSIFLFILIFQSNANAAFDGFDDTWIFEREAAHISFDKNEEIFSTHGINPMETLVAKKRYIFSDNQEFYIYRLCCGWSSKKLFFYFITKDQKNFYRLDGSSAAPIRKFILENNIKIDIDDAPDYVRLITFFARGKEGPFLPIEREGEPYVPNIYDLEVPEGSINKEIFGSPRDSVSPIACRIGNDNFSYICAANVMYSNAIFKSEFGVTSEGAVEMLWDEPVIVDLPVKSYAPISVFHLSESDVFVPKEHVPPVAAAPAPAPTPAPTRAPASKPSPPGNDGWSLEKLLSWAFGVEERAELNNRGRFSGDAFAKLNLIKNNNVVVSESNENDAIIIYDGNKCQLYMVDDTGNHIIIIDMDINVSIGSTKYFDGNISFGNINIGGLRLSDIRNIYRSTGRSTGLHYVNGSPNFGFLEVIFKNTQFWAQINYGGADINIRFGGLSARKTISPIQGAWANGQMTRCVAMYER